MTVVLGNVIALKYSIVEIMNTVLGFGGKIPDRPWKR